MHQFLPRRGEEDITSCGVEAATAALAFEVLGLLVVDQDLEVVEVALAVVAPRTSKDLLDVGVISLLLAHVDGARDGRTIAGELGRREAGNADAPSGSGADEGCAARGE